MTEGKTSSRATTGPVGFVATTALLFAPITVLTSAPGEYTLVMPWGFLTATSLAPDGAVHVYALWTYFADQPRSFATLPSSIQAWPVALGLHLLAIGSAGLGALADREDRRVTGGLLVLAGIATVSVAIGVAVRFGVGVHAASAPVVPIGSLLTWGVAVGWYGPDLRRAVGN